MATRREVELIIRARDQAKAAVEKVNAALEELAVNEERVGRSSRSANTLLGRLSGELANLQRQATGLTSLGRVAQQLERASTSVTRLERASRDAQDNLISLGQRSTEAGASFGLLQSRAAQAAAEFERQKSALTAARQEQQRIGEQTRLVGERYKELRQQLLSTDSASDQLVQSVREQRSALLELTLAQDRSAAEVAEQRTAVQTARQAYRQLQRDVKGASTELDRANTAFDRAKTTAREQSQALETAKTEFSEMRNSARAAAQSLGGVELRQESVAQASRQTAAAISAVSAALERQRAAQSAGGGGLGGAAGATAAFREQVRAVREAEQAWREARQEANRLGTEIANTESPTAELRAEFVVAQEASREAARAYQQQALALERLRRETREQLSAAQAKKASDREAAVLAAHQADAEQRRARAQQQTAAVAKLLRVNVDQLNASLERSAAAGRRGADGIRRFGDNSRRALSLVQRVRGEILALTTSFLGLFAAIQGIGSIITAIRTIEAATSRLNAVFQGDSGRIRNELRFLSQEADRLGLSFQVLSQQYGKFAIATSAANFSSDATREIFISVAEAARVNKASTEELEGTYLALEQIVSKGNVTMEELRRQLGDRLPGAFNIFASALGVSTEELNRMIRAGEVAASEENLLLFARELQRRFGGALPAALRTTTTELDRFSNNLFEARARIGAGGFTDALRDALVELNEQFRSREGRDFFLQLGALLGNFVRALQFVVENVDLVVKAFQALIALKLSQFFIGLIQRQTQAALVSREMAAAYLSADAALKKQIVSQAVATNATGAFVGTMRVLLVTMRQAAVAIATTGLNSTSTAAALGSFRAAAAGAAVAARGLVAALGPIALAAGAAFLLIDLFTDTATAVPDATAALDEHTRQLDLYAKEAAEAIRVGREFNASLVDISALEARDNLEELSAAYADLRSESTETGKTLIRDFLRVNGGLRSDPIIEQLRGLTSQLKDGEISVKEYQDALAEMFETVDDPALTGLIARLRGIQEDTREAEQAMASQALIVERLGGDLGDLSTFYDRVGVRVNEATGEIITFNNELEQSRIAAQRQQEALGRIEAAIPQIARERSQDQRRREFEADAQAAVSGVTDPDELERINRLIDQRRQLLEEEFQQEEEAARRRAQRRDPQVEFNDNLRRGNDLRRFELSILQETAREQEIRRAIYAAEQRALEQNVEITQSQRDAIRETVGATFDATNAERTRNQVLQQQQRLRELLGQQISVQAQIEERARQQNIDLLSEEGRQWAEVTRQILERERAEEQLRDAIENTRTLEQERVNLQRELSEAVELGAPREEIDQRIEQLNALREQILQARDRAIELAEALGDDKAVAQLGKISAGLENQNQQLTTAGQINRDLADGLSGVALAFGEAAAQGEGLSGAFEAAGIAFRKFAAQFLLEIAKMIAQQAILNALQQSGVGGGIAGAINAIIAHRGGLVGSSLPRRSVPLSAFAGAFRYQAGGIAGLRPDEVPAVLHRGEEVITANDPRHRANGGAGGKVEARIINAIDPVSFVQAALDTPDGAEAVLNFIRANRSGVQGALA